MFYAFIWSSLLCLFFFFCPSARCTLAPSHMAVEPPFVVARPQVGTFCVVQLIRVKEGNWVRQIQARRMFVFFCFFVVDGSWRRPTDNAGNSWAQVVVSDCIDFASRDQSTAPQWLEVINKLKVTAPVSRVSRTADSVCGILCDTMEPDAALLSDDQP